MSYQIVPESAPFSVEQRAWLNGFLAGILGTLDHSSELGKIKAQGGVSTTLAAAASLLGAPLSEANYTNTNTNQDEEELPWHDPSLAIQDRLKLAEGKPKARRLMAAMAQLDCGSCGYLCKTYAEALANGTEKNMTLCSPGGSQTTKAIRQLVKETDDIKVSEHASTSTPVISPLGTRQNPVNARLIGSEKLNKSGSAKDTRHVTIDLTGTSLKYRVGDALGVFPSNCPELVKQVVAAAKLNPNALVSISDSSEGPRSIEMFAALEERCLKTVTSELIEFATMQIRSRPKQNGSVALDAEILNEIETFANSDLVEECDVLEFFQQFPSVTWTEQVVVDALSMMRPRLYSIASSQSKYASQVHLTVGRVESLVRDRIRKGVASTMFADRLAPDSSVKVFIHPSHGFTIPVDPSVPMIMVGPGTGIAPFISFLQQREADKAVGKNWLFFGDQKRQCDYLYREQLEAWQRAGLLTYLDLAFSRDGQEKNYVQHRMLENGKRLFEWLEANGHFYVCGDAARMAKDVDKSLRMVIAQHGGMNDMQAKAYIDNLVKTNRYVRDVY